MAPRRGAQRLLANAAKAAGARPPLLALALAALLLPGCGGDDSPEPEGAARQETSTQAPAEAPASAGGEGQKQSPGGPGKGRGEAEQPNVQIPEGEREPGITPEQRRKATKATIALQSPDLVPAPGNHVALPRSATCRGENTPPTLRWSGVPESAKELVLLLVNFKPIDEALFFGWAVAGLDPELTEIKAGELPAGAILGKNGFAERGYSVCPPKGEGETYLFTLYALPRPLEPEPGFDPLAIREEALAQAGNAGLLGVTYDVY